MFCVGAALLLVESKARQSSSLQSPVAAVVAVGPFLTSLLVVIGMRGTPDPDRPHSADTDTDTGPSLAVVRDLKSRTVVAIASRTLITDESREGGAGGWEGRGGRGGLDVGRVCNGGDVNGAENTRGEEEEELEAEEEKEEEENEEKGIEDEEEEEEGVLQIGFTWERVEKEDIIEVEPKEGTRVELELDSGIEKDGRGWNNERDESTLR